MYHTVSSNSKQRERKALELEEITIVGIADSKKMTRL